jgi:WD40 repeat protein
MWKRCSAIDFNFSCRRQMDSGKERPTLFGHSAAVKAVAFSPDGQRLASASVDKTVKLWDVLTGKERTTLRHGECVLSVAYSPDGKTAVPRDTRPND